MHRRARQSASRVVAGRPSTTYEWIYSLWPRQSGRQQPALRPTRRWARLLMCCFFRWNMRIRCECGNVARHDVAAAYDLIGALHQASKYPLSCLQQTLAGGGYWCPQSFSRPHDSNVPQGRSATPMLGPMMLSRSVGELGQKSGEMRLLKSLSHGDWRPYRLRCRSAIARARENRRRMTSEQ